MTPKHCIAKTGEFFSAEKLETIAGSCGPPETGFVCIVSGFNTVQTHVGFSCVGQKETRQILCVENDWFLHVADVLFVFDDSKASTSNI